MNNTKNDIPEYKIELIAVDENAKKARNFENYCWEKLGNRFKIGGKPDFIQEEDWPKCTCCNQKMSFYAQLDTIGSDFDIGDSGLIYVFYCFYCNKAKAIVQSY